MIPRSLGAVLKTGWMPLAILGMVLLLPPTRAQNKEVKEPEHPEIWFPQEKQRAQAASAALMVSLRNPFATVLLCHDQKVWGIEEADKEDVPFVGQFAPSLDRPEVLACLKAMHRRPMPDDRKGPLRPEQRDFIVLYAEALWQAKRVPAEVLARTALEHVTFGHLYDQPELYWGKIITLPGKLVRVSKEPTFPSAKKKGVPHYYTGHMFSATKGAHAVGLAFAHLPVGVKIAENLRPELQVTFHGYFLGLVKYRGADGKDRVTPLLVGRMVRPAVPLAQTSPWARLGSLVLYGILGTLTVVVLLVVGLNLWFRKGDREVRDRLARIQAERTVQALEHAENLEALQKTDGNGLFTDLPNKPPGEK